MINENQKQKRQNYIGASEVPILFGLSRFKSLYELWAEKTGRLEPQDLSNNHAVAAGVRFEPAVIQFLQEELKTPISADAPEAIVPDAHLIAHPDAMVVPTSEPVEVKVEGLFSRLRDGWGEPMTDQVPPDVLLQAIAQAVACKAAGGHIAAFLGGIGFARYIYQADPAVAQAILDRCGEFWDSYVVKDTPPPDTPPVEILTKLKRRPELPAVEVPVGLYVGYEQAKQAVKEAQELADARKAELLAALGDAAEGYAVCSNGKAIIRVMSMTRENLDAERLKQEMPDIYEKYKKELTYQQARITFKKG